MISMQEYIVSKNFIIKVWTDGEIHIATARYDIDITYKDEITVEGNI